MEREFRRRGRNQTLVLRAILSMAGGTMVLLAACRLGPKGDPGLPAGYALQYNVGYSKASAPFGEGPVDSGSLHLEDPLAISVTFVAMPKRSEGVLAPVASQTQMITVLPASTAVVPVAGLLRSARVGIVEDAAPFLKRIAGEKTGVPVILEKLRGILPYGVETSFQILERPVLDSGPIRKLGIQVRRQRLQEPQSGERPGTTAVLEISLVATGHPPSEPSSDEDSRIDSGGEPGPLMPVAPEVWVTETISLTPQALPGQDRLAMVLPSPFDVEGIVAFAALIEVRSPPPEGTDGSAAHAVLLQQCQDALLAAANGAEDGQRPGVGRRGLEDAIRLLPSPTHKRRALLHLGRETGSLLIEDLALSASDVVLDRLAYAIANEHLAPLSVEADGLGWRLEKTAYQLLTEPASSDLTSPDLEAILIRHTGEVGRHPSVLREVVSEVTSMADLRQRLLLENSIYLEDISPAARARAFDWLAVQGQAPQGYDPLASLAERRRVLNQVLQEQP